MQSKSAYAVAAALVLASPVASAASASDVTALKKEIEQLRQSYEARIEALEARLKAVEKTATEAQVAASTPPPPAPAPAAAANSFNPAIGVVLDGRYRDFQRGTDGGIAGFATGDEAGRGLEGLALGESEVHFAANIDDKFYGSMTASMAEENGDTSVALEEAYIQTLALPAGLTAKAGRFYSSIGYLNGQHPHVDDFADRPLPYRAMLNKQFGDDGVQLRWVAPTDLFVELGGEAFRGAGFPAGGASNQGKGAWSAFGHVGGDVGVSSSWRAGLSYLYADADARDSGDPGNPDVFTGSSKLWIADAIWKWAPNGNTYDTNFKLQGEYFRRAEDGLFTPATGISAGNGLSYDGRQSGWYLQGVYQFMPRWRAGLRWSGLKADDPGPAFAGSALDIQGHDPRMYSVMVDWSNSEFSRFRLQLNRDESSPITDNQWILQYIVSLGAHGAHQY